MWTSHHHVEPLPSWTGQWLMKFRGFYIFVIFIISSIGTDSEASKITSDSPPTYHRTAAGISDIVRNFASMQMLSSLMARGASMHAVEGLKAPNRYVDCIEANYNLGTIDTINLKPSEQMSPK
jgi:hypothetical protein